MKIDELRGIVYVAVTAPAAAEGEDEWSHPLVRRQRMNLEQSLLVAILRQQLVIHEQEAGLGASAATVALEDLLPHLQMYLGNLGSDTQEQKRLRGLLEQLKGYGLVSEVDAHDQIQIRPIMAHLANPVNRTSLLHAFRDASHRAPIQSSPDWGPFAGRHRVPIDPAGTAIIGATGSGHEQALDDLEIIGAGGSNSRPQPWQDWVLNRPTR
jgi:hypothetical protein